MYQWLQRLFTGSDQGADEKKPVPAPPPKPAPAPMSAPVASAPTPAPPAPAQSVAPPAAAAAPPKPSQTAVTGLSFDQKDDINAAYYDWLFERDADADLDTNPLEEQVLEAIDKIIKSKSSGADMVRRMPGLIPQLLQSLKSDNFSGAQLSRTISHDVVLVAAVIRLANSSILATSKTITSVEHAVIRIGQEGLRQLITSVAFRPIIDMHSGAFTRVLAPRIWDQSERNALANRIMAEAMGIDPFEAFLAGLVQNVGLIVTLRIMDQAAKDSKHLGSEMFCAALLRDARTLSCTIAREWNFAPAISQAISEQGNVRKGESMSPLGRLLALGDYLAKARILVDHERINEADPRLFRGLSPGVRECFQALDAPVMDEAGGATPA